MLTVNNSNLPVLPMEINLARRTELWSALAQEGQFVADDRRGRRIVYTTSTGKAFNWRTRDILGALFHIWEEQGGRVSTNALLKVETNINEVMQVLGCHDDGDTWKQVFEHLKTLSKTFFIVFEEFYDVNAPKKQPKKRVTNYALFTGFEITEGTGKINFILSPLFALSLSSRPQYIPQLPPSKRSRSPAVRHLLAYVASNKGFKRKGREEWQLTENTALAVMGINDSNPRRAKQKAVQAAKEVAQILGMEARVKQMSASSKLGNSWKIVLSQELQAEPGPRAISPTQSESEHGLKQQGC